MRRLASPERIRSMTQLPRMFIGCSSESLQVARYLQAELRRDVESDVWDEGVFGLSGGTLEDLAEEVRRFQFAALVLAPDDVVIKRAREGNAPRDNVLFEAGFFMGFRKEEDVPRLVRRRFPGASERSRRCHVRRVQAP